MVTTGHDFRGAWIPPFTTSREGLSADAQKAQMVRFLEAAKRWRQYFDAAVAA